MPYSNPIDRLLPRRRGFGIGGGGGESPNVESPEPSGDSASLAQALATAGQALLAGNTQLAGQTLIDLAGSLGYSAPGDKSQPSTKPGGPLSGFLGGLLGGDGWGSTIFG